MSTDAPLLDAPLVEAAELAAFQRSATGLAIVDWGGALVSVNASFAELHGRDVADLLGSSVTRLNPDGEGLYRAEAAEAAAFDAALTYTFVSIAAGRPSATVRYRLRQLCGEGRGLLLLLEAEAVAFAPQLVAPGRAPELVVDRDGRVAAANDAAAALLGRENGSLLVGRPLSTALHPGDGAVVEQLLARPLPCPAGGDGAALAAANPRPKLEVRALRPDGAVCWLGFEADHDCLAERRPGAVLISLTDLTERKRDELLLQEAFDARPQPFVMIDPEGRTLAANAAWRSRFGQGGPPPAHLADLLDGVGADELAEQLLLTARDEQRFFEIHALSAPTDNAPRALHLRGTALHDLAGRLERVLVEIDDVTDAALEIENARANALWVRSVVDLVDHAVVIHDQEGRVIEVNLGAHRLFGQGASDLVGQRSLPLWWRPVLSDGTPLAETRHPALRVIEDRLPLAEATIGVTLPGSTVRWFVARARPVAGEAGRRGGAVVAYTEITDQRALLDAARDAETDLADLFDTLPVAAYTTDATLTPQRVNAAWQEQIASAWPRPPADLLGIADPADRLALGAALDAVVGEGREAQLFHRLRGNGQHARWVLHRVAPRRSGGPGAGGVVGTVQLVPSWVAEGERTTRLLHLVESTNDVVGEYDLIESRFTYLNPRARELFVGAARDDRPVAVEDLQVDAILGPEGRELFEKEVWPAIRSEGRWEGELPMTTADGRVLLLQLWITGHSDPDGRLRLLGAAGHDVTNRSQREAELSLRATHDELTGLPNRALLLDHLELALARARRTGQLVALIILDLDRFKSVNDRLGAEAGDQLLRQAADRLVAAVRPGDTVARLGGDEFVALCDGVDDREHALAIADAITATVGDLPFQIEGNELRATASVGVALSGGVDHPEALLRDADAAMYRAKELGRARLEMLDEGMRSLASSRTQLTEELREALSSGAITVHYQPSIDLRSGLVRSVECLVRWQHPERGLLHPGEFIGVADSSGLVRELGLEVLGQACRKARQWQDRWGPAAPRMHVNLSSRQVADPALVGLVSEVLAESGVDPSLICLELTESMLLEDTEAAIAAITALRALGITLAIDDFGTGYSSLSYLSRLPVDAVKIDKSFVDGLDGASGDTPVVVAAIVSLARSLGLATIAEGVTTVAQLGELHRLGCDAAQGYYFSAPLDEAGIDSYLSRRLPGVEGAEG